ncbi:COG3904 family protein [Microbulbifer sp. 2201CG32-9]|uniref:COG3904 family protein n=1 Tax=Microbulbifer sp. 2201CG32-9 TaxID=3232309 RepID=UPI00345BBB01
MKNLHTKLLLLVAVISTTGCVLLDDYEKLSFVVQGDRLVAQGVIDGSTPDLLRKVVSENAQIKTLVLQFVPGSVDDEANLETARFVRSAGLHTLVPTDGIVASGGTDLFLAGETRSIEPGACVGVHSWAEAGLFGGLVNGDEVPRDDPQHRLYLDYYDEMGIASEFYWYTLEAAPADSIYWMPAEAINRFGMSTQALPSSPDNRLHNRCETLADRESSS